MECDYVPSVICLSRGPCDSRASADKYCPGLYVGNEGGHWYPTMTATAWAVPAHVPQPAAYPSGKARCTVGAPIAETEGVL